jgi:hypothetical protein
MRMPAGWNIRVTTFDSEGNPRIVRNFLAYESDKEGAIELVRKRIPVNEGELAEGVAEVSGNEFVGPGMRPGDVRRLGKKADLDEGKQPPRHARGRLGPRASPPENHIRT